MKHSVASNYTQISGNQQGVSFTGVKEENTRRQASRGQSQTDAKQNSLQELLHVTSWVFSTTAGSHSNRHEHVYSPVHEHTVSLMHQRVLSSVRKV